MGNIVGSSRAVSQVIADDFATLQQGVAAANRAQPHALAPRHLLAPSLWDGHLRDFLVKQLDLWPPEVQECPLRDLFNVIAMSKNSSILQEIEP
jgi:hypothetical protein